MPVRKQYLPWLACVAMLAAGVPALASGEERAPRAVDAAFDVHDNSFDDAAGGAGDHMVSITTGGTVTFKYANDGTNASVHNADFSTGPAPATCKQTAAGPGYELDPDDKSPLPSSVQGTGWEGFCTFTAPGTYTFFCQAHGGMEGTIEVTGAGTPTATATATETPTATATETATATPVVPAATPTPTPVATPVVTPAAKPAAKISAASFKRSKRTLTVSGTTTATGKVTVKLAYKVGKKSRTKTFSATVKSGKFSGTLKLAAADAKKASKLSVTVSATGAPPAKKTVSVKR